LKAVDRRRFVAGAGVIVLVAAPAARAGGDFVDLAVGPGRVWFVGVSPGVRSLDARTGRTVSTRQLVGAAYPLSVALAGGAAWVGSVENGYVWGTLSRRRRTSSVQYVAAGADSVWALIGSAKTMRIARFTLSGRFLRVWRVPDAGRIAADRRGCWISGGRSLLRIDPAGRLHRVLRAPIGDVATGAGAVWLPRARSVLRLDERTGRVRILPTGRLDLGGFQHDIAVGDGALWALHNPSRTRAELVRYDLRTGRRTGSARLPGIADALVVRPGAVWVATIAAGGTLLRLDPRTLRRTLVVHIV
jgi:hypothetical protein